MNSARLATPLLVRLARLDDIELLHAACFPEQPMERVADYLEWCLASPDRPLRLVGVVENHVVAHVELTARAQGAWTEISSLVVTPGMQGIGIGRRVVGAAVRLARRWGCSEVRLQVQEQEHALVAMYCRWGFHTRGEPLAGRRWLVMAVNLDSPEPKPAAPTRALGIGLPGDS